MMVLASAVAIAATVSSPFNTSGYSSYQINKDNEGKLVVNGVDVSVFQSRTSTKLSKSTRDATSNVKWDTLKAANVDFAILRVGGTYAASLDFYKDQTLKDHYTKAKNAGLMTGAYWLSQATTPAMAVKEADQAVALLKKNGIGPDDLDFPVYMDYEFVSGGKMTSSNLTKDKGTAAAKAFTERIASYGYQSGIYASTSFYNKYIDASQLAPDCRLWIAQYYYLCEYSKHSYDAWQYSSSGRMSNLYVDASNSGMDCNFWYLDTNRTSEDAGDIGSCSIACERYADFKSNGTKHAPAFIVRNSEGAALTNGVDYVARYLKNTREGTAYLYIRGIGKYKGYKTAAFSIVKNAWDNYDLNACSDAVEFNDEAGYTVSSDGKVLSNIELGTTVEELLDNITLKDGYTAEVVNTNKTAVSSGKLATGYRLIIRKLGMLDGAATLSVKSDLNGDGEQTEADITGVAASVIGAGDAAHDAAADINEDGKLTIEDIVELQRIVLGIKDAAVVSEPPANVVIEDPEADSETASATESEASEEPEQVAFENATSEQAAEAAEHENSKAAESAETVEDVIEETSSEEAALTSAIAPREPVEVELPAGISVSKSTIYRGGYFYITLTVNGVDNNRPGAVILDITPNGTSCMGVYSGNAVYKNNKLVMFTTDGSNLKCTLKFRGDTAGYRSISFAAEGRTLDRDIFSMSVKTTERMILPAAAKLKKVTKGSKRFKATWKKVKGISGYQIRYSRYSSMAGAATVNVSAKSTSKTVKGLAKKKKYYVQIRTYLYADGGTSFSDWSGVKSVKTK